MLFSRYLCRRGYCVIGSRTYHFLPIGPFGAQFRIAPWPSDGVACKSNHNAAAKHPFALIPHRNIKRASQCCALGAFTIYTKPGSGRVSSSFSVVGFCAPDTMEGFVNLASFGAVGICDLRRLAHITRGILIRHSSIDVGFLLVPLCHRV